MANVLINDSTPDVSQKLKGLLGDSAVITDEPYSEKKQIIGYDLVILYSNGSDSEAILTKAKSLYSRTKFRNIPIILLRHDDDSTLEQPYLNFGVSEFMMLSDPPPVLRQILQGYLTPGRKPLDREMQYLIPFIKSTQIVMSKMASMKAEFKEVYFKNNLRILGDVSGIVGLSGNAEGTVVITFRWRLAQKVVSNVMMVKDSEINPEIIHDGVGEIVNMISGAAKKTLTKFSYDLQLSIPTIIVGWGHEAGYPENATIAVLVFEVGNEAFVLNVSLSQNT